MQRLFLKIYGKVQGVSFRFYAKREAIRLGITGWIRNKPDGTVEAEIEGEKRTLEQFLRWCQRGTSHARVEKVAVKKMPIKERAFKDFYIRH
jgi:acylphosphatase